MYRNLLVPLDGSDLAEQALPHARAMAERFGAAIVLARAVEPVVYVAADPALATGEAARLISNQWASARSVADNYLQQARQRLPAELAVDTQVLDGPPAESLLDFAEQTGVNLIVMTTHGHSGLGHLFFGSVAEQILHRARVPMLLIRVA